MLFWALRTLGTCEMWRDPDDIDTKVSKVVELGDDTLQVSNAVIVGVFEAGWIYLVCYSRASQLCTHEKVFEMVSRDGLPVPSFHHFLS